MMIKIRTMTAAALIAAASPVFATDAPYAGQDARAVAALSAADIDDLLAGRGWGFAKPAELNGYPGPTHLLELAEELSLNPAQRDRIEAIRTEMEARAQTLGAAYVAAEAALDAGFAGGGLSDEALGVLVAEAEGLRADLRAVHLAAHLEVKPLLTRHQIVTYNRLRGYGDGDAGHGGQGNGHGHE